jgi:hypothetical protein
MTNPFVGREKLEPRRGVSLSVLDGHGVLFHEAQQKVYRLDPLTTVVWRCLWDNRATYKEASESLAELAGCSGEQAKEYVEACLATLQAHDFVARTEPGNSEAELLYPPVRTKFGAGIGTDVFQVAGTHIGVSYADMLVAKAVRAIMGHLLTKNVEAVDINFHIAPDKQGYMLIDHLGKMQFVADAGAAAVNLKNSILDHILHIWPNLFALHAGALLAPSGVVLLVGPSGRGKTTLTALLNSFGWPSIADDVVLLESGNSLVKGLAFAYAAKPGSWPLLCARFPTMVQQQPWLRPDGRQVKYIVPHLVANLTTGMPVSYIFFPQYKDCNKVLCSKFGRINALELMLSEAMNSNNYLTVEGFNNLCRLINGAVVTHIEYSCAYDAANLVHNMISGTCGGCAESTEANP